MRKRKFQNTENVTSRSGDNRNKIKESMMHLWTVVKPLPEDS